MTTALIGYTGFVGSTLLSQTSFDQLCNSKNIEAIRDQSFDQIICAGVPAEKWKANQNPAADLSNLQRLMNVLDSTHAREFILISTVDVYWQPSRVDENTPINEAILDAYGLNRYRLEKFAQTHFERCYIVRLPGLFGKGLKKNFIFDLLHSGESAWTHCDSTFQFYNMALLWHDLQSVRGEALPVVNFATRPVSARDVAQRCFGLTFNHVTEKPPVAYDMQTCYADRFGGSDRYLTTAAETFEQIAAFVEASKSETI